MEKDYYKVLGVDRNADQKDIKEAYRSLCKKYHPDINKDPGAEEKFKDVGEAFNVIGNEENRKAYDVYGENWKHGNPFQNAGYDRGFGEDIDLNDLMSSVFNRVYNKGGRGNPFSGFGDFGDFGDFFNNQTNRSSNRNIKRTVQLSLTVEEAFNGVVKEIIYENVLGNKKTQLINIPAGTVSGQVLRIDVSMQKVLIDVHIKIKPHAIYQLQDKDVYIFVFVTPWEILNKATIKIPTLYGDVNLKLPDSIKNGQMLKLKGKGFPGVFPGDQFVQLILETPEPKTDEQKQAYKDLEEAFKDYNPREYLFQNKK